ncbi:MAG: hypothetical protein ACAH83_14095 [Alphaproteobacteria bacterium]
MQTVFRTKGVLREAFHSDATRFFARAILPPVLAAIGAWCMADAALDLGQTPADVQTKATKLWRDNGYEVTGFKSYEGGRVKRSVTLNLKKDADGKPYEGTATCAKSCVVDRITAL